MKKTKIYNPTTKTWYKIRLRKTKKTGKTLIDKWWKFYNKK